MRDGRLLREEASDASRPQATRLPGELAVLLERESIALGDVDVLAACVGPGSFTGLRVGIAAMQGLALALKKPLVGVSAFDALARVAARQLRGSAAVGTATWIDAWRGEVYAALYRRGEPVGAPTVDRPETLLAQLAGQDILFTGDGAALYEALIRSTLGSSARVTQPVAPLLAGAIAALAVEETDRGHAPAPHAIRPLYVRRSDAELARSAKRATGAGRDHVRTPRP